MSKETDYRAQLEALGTYNPAFDSAIHTLCIMERELSRAMKAWKSASRPGSAPQITDPLYEAISKLRRDILARQVELGLTPKSLQRIRKSAPEPSADAPGNKAFSDILDKLAGETP